MSESYSYKYSVKHQEYLARQAARDERHEAYLERQAAREVRQRLYFDRIQANVTLYRDKYETLLEDMVKAGFEEYLPTEFAQIRSRLSQLNSFLISDPEHARELSLQIGAEISGLKTIARSAKREFEIRERERQQELAAMRNKATTELGLFVNSVLGEIRDPIVQDFAFEKLKAIQAEYDGQVVAPQDLPRIKDELRSRVKAISDEALTLAQEWKQRKAEDGLAESQNSLLDIHREQASLEAGHHSRAVEAMLDSLDAMRQQVSAKGCSMVDVQKQLAEATEKVDGAVANEDCRRIVVRAILDSLQKTGFSVGVPQRSPGERDEVVILARKPSGAEARFSVAIDGVLVYKFDHYEGTKCKADIDQVLPMLQEIYGIELSEERILWQNPDRLSMSAKPINGGSKENSRG